jgi:hypothetical protein
VEIDSLVVLSATNCEVVWILPVIADVSERGSQERCALRCRVLVSVPVPMLAGINEGQFR